MRCLQAALLLFAVWWFYRVFIRNPYGETPLEILADTFRGLFWP